MRMDATIHARIEALVRKANEYWDDDDYESVGRAWLASALNIIEVLCPDESNSYRKQLKEIEEWSPKHQIPVLGSILPYLAEDINAGLLISIADRATAETFDDFLDHAANYQDQGRAREAGVIAGVVFEDTVRRICGKHKIINKDVKLDDLISALAKRHVLTGTKAKRARVGAHVRTKATHAQWDEFDLADVSSTIEITRELILRELDA